MSNSIADRIKIKRLELGLSQLELSKLSSIAAAQISRYESGVTEPSSLVASRLAKSLNVDVVWLLTGDRKNDSSNVGSNFRTATFSGGDDGLLRFHFSPDATKKLNAISEIQGKDVYVVAMNLIYDAIDREYKKIIDQENQ